MQSQAIDQKIVQQFRTIRNRQLFVIIPMILAALTLVWVADNPGVNIGGIPGNVLETAVFVVIIGIALFSLYNWRCPACKKYLGKGISPQFCSGCGVQLR